jgi:5-formyltetrahydrofolate cyclo-ligase
MDKKNLRKMMIQQRRNLSSDLLLENSEKIANELMKHPIFRTAKNILFYVSNNSEVHTHKLIKKSLSLKKNVYVPISETKNHTLRISQLKDWSELTPGAYSILEPLKEKERIQPISVLELIIVPGTAFDEKGHRLGQGGGYYDWLLSKTTIPTIALAFESQIIDVLPIESHDQRVDNIITEKRIIDCNSD